MRFESLINKSVKEVSPDIIRAKSLLKSSFQALETARSIPLKSSTLKTILRELYESLRQICEAIGYRKGYKFLDHASITLFLKDKLSEEGLSQRFDHYRKLRNGINYYGNEISLETTRLALREIPKLIGRLRKGLEES